MTLFLNDAPDEQQVLLRVMDEHVTLNRFVEYGFASDFLTPSDGWSFTIGDEDLPTAQRNALKVGARVGLFVNHQQLADGYIDTVRIGASKTGGQRWCISGRDRLGAALDSTADPKLKFKTGSTLADVLKTLFEPFGWVGDDHFLIDNQANRDAITGGTTRALKSSKGRKTFGRALKDQVIHQLQPYNHESVFHFASRICQRFGLWIWCTSDGEKLVISKPDFLQEPRYSLFRKLDGTGNIIDGEASFDGTDQPSILIADSFGAGGEYGKGRYRAFSVNPCFGVDVDGFVLDEVSQIISTIPDAEQITLTTQPFKRRVATMPPRPMFLHDDEAKTPEQLENFVRREMSLLLRKSVTCEYTVDGHGQTRDGFTAWGVDTVVDVQDDVTDIHERMYVLGVNYSKSRGGAGTTTKLHLVRLNSIEF